MVYAQTSLGGRIGEGEGLGPFANISLENGQGLVALTKGISALIGLMTVLAGIWFMFQFLIGGFYWITSGGEKSKLESARDRITNAFIGLVVVVAGWSILALAGQFLGLDTTISDPVNIMNLITPKL